VTRRPAVDALWDLLDAEHAAARTADVDRLVALQKPKELAIARILEGGVDDGDLTRLQSRARDNIALMRQLVKTIHGLLLPESTEATYDTAGRTVSEGGCILRGRA
jgi:hypothetical protein